MCFCLLIQIQSSDVKYTTIDSKLSLLQNVGSFQLKRMKPINEIGCI